MRAAGCSKSSPSSRARLGCAFRGSVGLHPPPAAALSVWGRTSPPKAGTACFVLRDHQPKLSPAGVSFLMVTLRGGELPAFGGAAGAFFSEPLGGDCCRFEDDGRSARRGRASGLPCWERG